MIEPQEERIVTICYYIECSSRLIIELRDRLGHVSDIPISDVNNTFLLSLHTIFYGRQQTYLNCL